MRITWGANRYSRLAALAWAAFLYAAPLAHADPAVVTLRFAVHDGDTRLVFDFAAPTHESFHRDGNCVTLSFADPSPIQPPAGFAPASLPNLLAARFTPGHAVLTLAPGVRVHSMGLGSHRVVDLLAPTHPSPPATEAAIAPIAAAHMKLPATAVAALPPIGPLALDLPAAAPEPAARADGPAPELPPRAATPLPDDPQGPGLTVSFSPGTGAAAFRRGSQAIIVFDENRPLDAASIRAVSGFGQARVQALAEATVLTLPLPSTAAIGLARHQADWTITILPAAPSTAADALMPANATGGNFSLATAHAARTTTIPDPLTGDDLLVGTVRDAPDHTAAPRHFVDFDLLQTWLGAAIAPRSDRPILIATASSFTLHSFSPAVALALSASGPRSQLALQANALTRDFDFPNLPSPALLRRLHAQMVDAASVPLLARLKPRASVAQTMIALGMGAEASGVLRLAAGDDPRALADPQTSALAAIAAQLTGRTDETAALSATPSPESDEHALWRALHDAALLDDSSPPTPATTAAIGNGLPLLLSYPPTLQRSLLPLAADTLLRGGALDRAAALLGERPADPSLDLARATLAQLRGDPAAALDSYDRLSAQPDRSVRARAATAAIALRLATHRISAAQAADAGERLFYAWRGDHRERDLHLEVANWRGQAGQYRQQLETLREAEQIFPEPADGVHDHLLAAFAEVVRNDQVDKLAPLDLVALVQENGDLLPPGEAGEAMVGKLADRLVALDLPAQAETVLAQLTHTAATAPARGTFGTRLAALQLADNQPQAALDTLAASQSAELSPSLATSRDLLAAQARAATGDKTGALVALNALPGLPAMLARAHILEDAHDWPAAEAALATIAATTVPSAGKLDAAQTATILRLASAAAQCNDDAKLAQLQQQDAPRLADPSAQALLGVLAEPPIRAISDLPRAAAETTAARAVPQDIAQLP